MSRWFSTTMRASTLSSRRRRPSSALRTRDGPSKEKGVVTTAIARAPISRATSATTGALPVPVPPPMPAVMNTRSEPLSDSAMRSRSSMAAFSPIPGFAPAPRPFVRWSPIWMRSSARLVARTCASVLAATNSTPLRPVSIMRLTALLPPPPRPMTRMTAFSLLLIAMRSRSPDPATLEEVLYDVPDPLEPTTTSTQVALPLLTPRHGGGVAAVLLHAEPDQPYRRGVGGTSHHVRQAGYAVGLTYPHGETEAFVRDLVDARHERGPAGD